LVVAGADDVLMQEFNMPDGTPTSNVIAVHYGTTKKDEIVVVGAHFDSISQKPTSSAPGAIDNGSGSTALMLLAQAIGSAEFARTVHFVAFSGEEQGLYGSAHYVKEAKKAGLAVVGALTMDMISFSAKYYGVTVEGTKDTAIKALQTLTVSNMQQFAPKLDVRTSDNSFGSDHVSFQEAGIPAILAIELDDGLPPNFDITYPDYHTTKDSVANCNEAQSVDIVKGLAGTLYDLANPSAQ
jgi:Zn-dependent M28 family amino/carboxypeptidase